VISIPDFKVLGHIPTGWFPSKVEVSRDGKNLIIANAKGFGSGPNGGANYEPGPEGTYIGSLMKGTLQVVEIPDDEQLKEFTARVIGNNFSFNKSSDSIFGKKRIIPCHFFRAKRKAP